MAMLEEINELTATLSQKRLELTQAEAKFLEEKDALQKEETKPVGPQVESYKNDIIRLLKEIQNLNRRISIKYLSLSSELNGQYDNEELLKMASEFARHASKADAKANYYTQLDSNS